MESLHPREIDLGLTRIKVVADRLGIDKKSSRVITVAGTNGKGSCVRSLERLLACQGRQVGSYTSPHILRYNERIRINELPATDEQICSAFATIDAARDEITVTYFEFATLAALLLFQQSDLDFWILEVGLGGRLDAVNMIDPDVAVITSIDLDHEHWLGDTREKIAVEKLGILRDRGLCVSAEDNAPANMDEIFASREAKVYRLGREFFLPPDWQTRADAAASGEITSAAAGHAKNQAKREATSETKNQPLHLQNVSGDVVDLYLPPPQLPPKSVAAALQVLLLLDQLPELEVLSNEIEKLRLAGRFEQARIKGQDCIFDVAHNPAAGQLLATKIKQFYKDYNDHHIVALVGMLADKKIAATLAPLTSVIDHWVCCSLRDTPRSQSADNIKDILLDLGVEENKVDRSASAERGFEDAVSLCEVAQKSHDKRVVLLVFGSFYTVAAVKLCFAEAQVN